jgi:hypothetical protein
VSQVSRFPVVHFFNVEFVISLNVSSFKQPFLYIVSKGQLSGVG